MFQGTVSWAFFQLSRGSVSELGARQRKGPGWLWLRGCLAGGGAAPEPHLCGDFWGPQEAISTSDICFGDLGSTLAPHSDQNGNNFQGSHS